MRHALLFALVLITGSCATPHAADRVVYRADEAPAPAVAPADRFHTPPQPTPARDMPESERIEWWERNRPARGHRPGHDQTLAPSVRVETVRVVERGHDHGWHDHVWHDVWWPSLAVSLGYWSRSHHGWRWGIGWHLPVWYGAHARLHRHW